MDPRLLTTKVSLLCQPINPPQRQCSIHLSEIFRPTSKSIRTTTMFIGLTSRCTLPATRSIRPIAGSIFWTCRFICHAWRSITPTSKFFSPYNLVDSPHIWTYGPIHLGCVNFGASSYPERPLCHSLILETTADHRAGTMTWGGGGGDVKSIADLDRIDGTTLISILLSFLTEGAPNYYPNSFSGPLDNLKHTPHAVKVFPLPPLKYYGLPFI